MRKFDIWAIATVLSLGLAACASSREYSTATRAKVSSPSAGLTINSPIRDLLGDPGAVGVLRKDMPGMLSDPRLDMVKSMSLRQISQYPDADLDSTKLKLIQADLNAVAGDMTTRATASTSTAATPALPPLPPPTPPK